MVYCGENWNGTMSTWNFRNKVQVYFIKRAEKKSRVVGFVVVALRPWGAKTLVLNNNSNKKVQPIRACRGHRLCRKQSKCYTDTWCCPKIEIHVLSVSLSHTLVLVFRLQNWSGTGNWPGKPLSLPLLLWAGKHGENRLPFILWIAPLHTCSTYTCSSLALDQEPLGAGFGPETQQL